MLKIQKKSKNGQISILIRDKERLFNKTLLVAGFLAFSFHAVFFLIFHIAPFKIPFGGTMFPPVSVESSINLKNVAAVITEEVKIPSFHGIPFPNPLDPKLDDSPHYIAIKSFEQKLVEPFFEELESELYLPIMEVPKKLTKPLIDVIVSGPLAEIKLKSFFVDEKLSKEIAFDARALYKVRVLGNTGKIFWYETIEETPLTRLNQSAENILKELSFASDSDVLEVFGEIEVHFHKEML